MSGQWRQPTARKLLTDTFRDEIGGQIWDQFTVHDMPTLGSWLNQEEVDISLFARAWGRGEFPISKRSCAGKRDRGIGE